MRYTQPVHDPFFVAERYTATPSGYRYKRNSYVSTMVCAEQHRWCRPGQYDDAVAQDRDCTTWDNFKAHRRAGFGDGGNVLGFSSVQRATAARLAMHNSPLRIIDSPVDLNTAGKLTPLSYPINNASSANLKTKKERPPPS